MPSISVCRYFLVCFIVLVALHVRAVCGLEHRPHRCQLIVKKAPARGIPKGKKKGDVCEKSCATADQLQIHQKFVHLGYTYKCPACLFTTKSREGMKSHIKQCAKAGPGAKPVEVAPPSRPESEPEDTEPDKKAHRCQLIVQKAPARGIPKGKKKGDICELGFATATHLRNHQKFVHLGYMYKCPACRFTAKSRNGVNTHIKKQCAVSGPVLA